MNISITIPTLNELLLVGFLILIFLAAVGLPYAVDYLCEHRILTNSRISCDVCLSRYAGISDNSTRNGCRNWNSYYEAKS